MTAGLLVSARKKQYLYIQTKEHQNNKTLYSYYLNYKNNFTKILRLKRKQIFIKTNVIVLRQIQN